MRLMKDDERPSLWAIRWNQENITQHHPKIIPKNIRKSSENPQKSEEMASDHCAVFAEMDFVEDPESKVKEEELLLIQ